MLMVIGSYEWSRRVLAARARRWDGFTAATTTKAVVATLVLLHFSMWVTTMVSWASFLDAYGKVFGPTRDKIIEAVGTVPRFPETVEYTAFFYVFNALHTLVVLTTLAILAVSHAADQPDDTTTSLLMTTF